MKKRMTIMSIALLVVFGGIIAFNLIKGVLISRFLKNMGQPTVTVSSVKAIKKNWKPTLAAVGNFVAINGVDVNSEASGNVVGIHFNSGEYVEKDTPLIDIDDHIDQATLKFNAADLSLQTLNYKRQKDLFARNATAKSSVDEAEAKLLQSQANLEKTQALINQKHITAPFSGQLGIRKINLGEYISPGKTAIVPLQSMDPLFLQFYLPEQLLVNLKLHQRITFSVEQNPGLKFIGSITAINAKIDTNTHTIEVQATLPNCSSEALKNPAHSDLLSITDNNTVICTTKRNIDYHVEAFNFMPGMFASIEIEQPAVPDTILLPSTAISYSLYGNSVFIIEEEKTDDKEHPSLIVKRVFVSTGAQQGNETVITKGLKEGQLVVASGELKLVDGTHVTINNEVLLKDINNPDQLGQ
jgi:membrane fusion protein, multidrug efflux system